MSFNFIRLIKNQLTFKENDQKWIQKMQRNKPQVISIMHPCWRGIRSSTLQLYPHHYFIDDNVSEQDSKYIANVLVESGCDKFLFSGLANGHIKVLKELHRISPHSWKYILWHANFLQSAEDYVWNSFKTILDFYRRGIFYKIGFVKKGMAEVLAKQGYRTGFVMNYVPMAVDAPSTPQAGGPHLGIWYIEENWRKQPFAMMAATTLIKDAVLHMPKVSERSKDFIATMGLKASYTDKPIPQLEMPAVLSKMHLNLYVTLSECAPMLPLESLSVGVPCLVGPSSHLFTDDQYLAQRLIVPYPDSAQVIGQYIEKALPEREQIVKHYIEYAKVYNARARESALAFIED